MQKQAGKPAPTEVYIQNFSRNWIISQIKLMPGQFLEENLVVFKLSQHINQAIKDLEDGDLGKFPILSVSTASYPVENDVLYLVTITYRRQYRQE